MNLFFFLSFQEALLNLQFGFRIKPLGFDRYYNRYWFFRGHAGLFIEKGKDRIFCLSFHRFFEIL